MTGHSEKGHGPCELLAPAGNFDMLRAAVSAGADACYLGLRDFNARRNADNFDYGSFAEACRYAHLRGARLYVALNTIIFESELEDAVRVAERAHEIGADAFIIQDLGLAWELGRRLPDARLHASTQMSIHSQAGLEMAASLGFARATLARELSVEEIGNLASVGKRAGVQIETFIHGALCISYSGQCLMSSMIGCRSANRGLCAQPCRLEYQLVDMRDPDRQIKSPGDHLLSPKDLCSIDDLCQLVRAGVSSLKVEGRMKSPEYVHTVVSEYRKHLDRVMGALAKGDVCPSADDGAHERLGSVFSRGFSSAYLNSHRDNSMMSYQRPNNRGQFAGRVKSADANSISISLDIPLASGDACEIWTKRGNLLFDVSEDAERRIEIKLSDTKSKGARDAAKTYWPSKGDRVFRIRSADAQISLGKNEPRIPVRGKVAAKLGSPFRIEFFIGENEDAATPSGANSCAYAEGPIVEAARTKSLTKDELYEHIARMGNSPFCLESLEVDLDDGVGMGFSQIHKTRASALGNLEEAMLAAWNDLKMLDAESAKPPASKGEIARAQTASAHPSDSHVIAALTSNPECARAAKRNGAEAIYVNALNYRRGTSQMDGMAQGCPSQAGYPKHCILALPAISHDAIGSSRESLLEGSAWSIVKEGSRVMVSSIDAIGHALALDCQMEIGPELPIVNHAALQLIGSLGGKRVWLTSELSLSQIKDLRNASNDVPELGIMVYGAQELMTCEHCALMSVGECDQDCPNCSRRKIPFALKDRKGYTFPIVTDRLGRSHIYNSLPTDNMNSLPELLDSGVKSFMINVQLLDPQQAAQETSRLRASLSKAMTGEADIPKEKAATTAHLHRPIS